MLQVDADLNLDNLIGEKFLQEFQDVFAKTVNMASFTYYNDNNKTTCPTDFSEFCSCIRKSEKGLKRCIECDLKWSKVAAESGKPVIYTCHAGLTDFAVPIVVNGNHLGTIFGGQILTYRPSDSRIRDLANELEINADELVCLLSKLDVLTKDKVEAAANLLYLVANSISEIGHKNLTLGMKSQSENLLRNLIETARQSLDIAEIRERIVEIVGQTLNADRCFIVQYDKNADEFLEVSTEYLSSDKVSSYKGVNSDIDIPIFLETVKNGKSLLINNKHIYTDFGDEVNLDAEYESMKRYNVYSAYAVPLYAHESFQGILSVHYVNEHIITPEEMNLLDIIANQTATAFHHAKMYDQLKRITANQNSILNNIPFMAWLKDKNSRFVAVNDFFAKVCNTTADKAAGRTDFEFFSEEAAQSYVNDDFYVMETGQALSIEEPVVMDGKPRIHETYKSPIYDSSGKVIGTVGLARDITERKEIELELLHRNEQIIKAANREKLLREIVSDISSTLDFNEIRKMLVTKLGKAMNADFDVLYVRDLKTGKFLPVDNHSIYSASKKFEELIGVNVLEEFDWAYYIASTSRLEVVYSDIEALINDYELRGSKAEEFLRKYNIQSMISIPIVHANNFLGLYIMNFVDEPREITEEDVDLVKIVANHSAIALYQARLYNQAQEASRAKSEFIANMSHEIKTPLNIIIGFSELLEKTEIEPSKQIKYLQNINQSGKHLLNLTNEIINVSKIEARNFEFNKEKFNSANVITDVCESMKLIAKRKKINIKVDVEKSEINADKKMFIQVLYNLLSNAVKFTNSKGQIIVTSRFDNDRLIVSIEDDGIGIDYENQKMIFEKFKQVDSSVEKSQQGLGLGLAISKELIELHDGSIHVSSKIGSGSKFWFTLPEASKPCK